MVKTKRKSGFTLTELLICVAILAVLSAISIPIISGIVNNSRDKSDKLNAELFTSYMTKYASETPKPASSYSNLDATEIDVVSFAGNSYFPGALQGGSGYYSTNAEVWKAIRREAIVAMKMYGEDIEVSDDYLIEGPQNAKKSYIYYYLKGTIEVDDLIEVKKLTAENLNNNIDSIDNYWVCLNEPIGNADAVNMSTTGDVYIKLYSYGLNRRLPVGFLEDCNIMSNIYLESLITHQKYFLSNTATANFENNNILQFSNVPKGEYQLFIYASNVTDLPSSEYGSLGKFSTSGKITVTDKGNVAGKSLTNPYNAYILAVTHGSVSVHYKTVKYNNDGFVSDAIHNFDKFYKLNFYHGDYEVTYSSDNYIKNLYDDSNSLYLPFETYRFTFSSNGYNNYISDVTSVLHGIYDKDSPNLSTSDFTYDFLARKTTVTINGTIDFGTGNLKLSDEISAVDTKYLKDTYEETLHTTAFTTKVLFVAQDGSKTYEISADKLKFIGNGKFEYTLENVEWSGDGTYYDVYFYNTFYGYNVPLSNSAIFVEGFDIEANYSTTSFFQNYNLKISKIATSLSDETVINKSVKLVDIYDENHTYTLENATAKSVRGGFYYVYINYPDPYDVVNDKVVIFVSSTDIDLLFNRTFGAVKITGNLYPKSGSTTISGSSDFYKIIKMTMKFTDANNSATDITTSNIKISGNGSSAKYEVTVPLASKYDYTITIDGSKCYNGTTSSTTIDSPVTSKAHDINIPRKTTTTESTHRGGMSHAKINASSHSVTCNFCTLRLDNHTGSTEVNIKKANCTANGSYDWKCTVSGCSHINQSNVSIPAQGHAYGSYVTTKNETCTANGWEEKTCTRNSTKFYEQCRNVSGRTRNAHGHSYSSNYTTTKNATCTSTGYKVRYCTYGCGAYTGGTTIAKKAHSWGSWWTDYAATCVSQGQEKRTCSVCKGTESRKTAVNSSNHSYSSSYTKISWATCTSDGIEVRYCTRSGCSSYTGSRVHQSALGHSKWWVYDGTDGDNGPKTGKHWQKCTRYGCSWTSKKEAHTNYWAGSAANALGKNITVNGSTKKCYFQYCKRCGYDP